MRITLAVSTALLSILAWPCEAACEGYADWAKELPEKAVEAKVGDKVRAYSFPWGYLRGTVKAVVEAGLVYSVEVDEEAKPFQDDGPKNDFFPDLLPAQ